VSQPEKESPTRNALGLTKAVIDIGAVWATFGYLSLRAFCNFAGIPLLTDIGFERYLEESFYLFMSIAVGISTNVFFILATLVCCGVALTSALIRRAPRPVLVVAQSRSVSTALILVACVLISAVGFVTISSYPHGLHQNVMIGRLVAATFLEDTSTHRYSVVFLAVLSCSGCLLLTSLPWSSSTTAAAWIRRALFSVLCLFSALLVLAVPLAFGATLRDREVYIVRMRLDEGTPWICGARMLESPQRLLFWQAKNGFGRIEAVATSRIKTVEYVRSANLWKLGLDASTTDGPQPECDDASPGAPK
jgi:hypothetical protein